MNKWLRFIIGFILVILYFVPYFILGEDAHLRIHDNLDSNVAWIKLLMDNNMLFAAPNMTLESVMGGLPLSSIYPSYNLYFILFKGFGIFYGYATSKLITALIGFSGMFFLQEEFREKFNLNQYIILITSVLFSILPHWGFEASVTGVPIIFYALLHFYNNKVKWYHWVIIIIMPFLSSFILTGLFILIIAGVHFLWLIYQRKRINRTYTMGILVLTLAYFVSIIPIFYTYFMDNAIITHRVEFKAPINSTRTAINLIFNLLKGEQNHSLSIHKLLLVLIPLYFIITVYKKNTHFV